MVFAANSLSKYIFINLSFSLPCIIPSSVFIPFAIFPFTLNLNIQFSVLWKRLLSTLLFILSVFIVFMKSSFLKSFNLVTLSFHLVFSFSIVVDLSWSFITGLNISLFCINLFVCSEFSFGHPVCNNFAIFFSLALYSLEYMYFFPYCVAYFSVCYVCYDWFMIRHF